MFTTESKCDLFAEFEDNTEAKDVTLLTSYDTDSIHSCTTQITQLPLLKIEQAKRMVKRNRVDLKAPIISDNVSVPIPAVARGRGNA